MTAGRPHLRIVPCTVSDAKVIVARWHRHHDPPLGALFAHAVIDDGGGLGGVALTGRPVARKLDDGWTTEVLRVATDGCDNACSALYGASRRTSIALGYRGGITYTLPQEGGASLRGAGWTPTMDTPGRSWSCPSRPRDDHHPLGVKVRWEWGVIACRESHPTRGLSDEDGAQLVLFATLGRTSASPRSSSEATQEEDRPEASPSSPPREAPSRPRSAS